MDLKVLQEIINAVDRGEKAALVTITNNRGSAPGKEGTIMAVFEDGEALGTVGGGAIEYDLIKKAIKSIEDEKNIEFQYDLNNNKDLNMICGGESKGFIRVFYPKEEVIIFGAGHIGIKVAELSKFLGFKVVLIDDRKDFKEKTDTSYYDEFIDDDINEVFEKITVNASKSYIVVCSHSHERDYLILKNLLNKDYKYLGVLGSRGKTARFKNNLLEDGFSIEKIEKIKMPIGLKISNGSVEEIAFSILAQILAVKNKTNI